MYINTPLSLKYAFSILRHLLTRNWSSSSRCLVLWTKNRRPIILWSCLCCLDVCPRLYLSTHNSCLKRVVDHLSNYNHHLAQNRYSRWTIKSSSSNIARGVRHEWTWCDGIGYLNSPSQRRSLLLYRPSKGCSWSKIYLTKIQHLSLRCPVL